MKCSRAAGSSGIITEMLKAAGEEGDELIRKLVEVVFSSGMIPVDCEENFILNLYKGKGDALDCGNYGGLKLIQQIMKLQEGVLVYSTYQMVNIGEMQFTFVPGKGTTDAIFIVCQLKAKYSAAAKKRF